MPLEERFSSPEGVAFGRVELDEPVNVKAPLFFLRDGRVVRIVVLAEELEGEGVLVGNLFNKESFVRNRQNPNTTISKSSQNPQILSGRHSRRESCPPRSSGTWLLAAGCRYLGHGPF